jgi:hypothetical protein
MNRRSVLTRLALGLPAARLAARHTAPGATGLGPQQTSLLALAEAVLPGELGSAGVAQVSERFMAWVRAWREGAEADHGYGHTALRHTGPSPVARYREELAALEAAARHRGGGLAELPLERRRSLVEDALRDARELPQRPGAHHVALDLMAFFFRSVEANDLCYRARIGRDTCRGLPDSGEPPAPRERS